MKRHFITRKKEHLKGQPKPTEVTQHEHKPAGDNFKIVFRTRFTKTAEALFIQSFPSNLLNEKDKQIPLLLF